MRTPQVSLATTADGSDLKRMCGKHINTQKVKERITFTTKKAMKLHPVLWKALLTTIVVEEEVLVQFDSWVYSLWCVIIVLCLHFFVIDLLEFLFYLSTSLNISSHFPCWILQQTSIILAHSTSAFKTQKSFQTLLMATVLILYPAPYCRHVGAFLLDLEEMNNLSYMYM